MTLSTVLLDIWKSVIRSHNLQMQPAFVTLVSEVGSSLRHCGYQPDTSKEPPVFINLQLLSHPEFCVEEKECLHNCSLNLITEFVDKTELAQLLVSVYSKSGSASREKNNRRKGRKRRERFFIFKYIYYI